MNKQLLTIILLALLCFSIFAPASAQEVTGMPEATSEATTTP